MGPLSGVKIVEIAGLGPAPVAGMMLADMGAEVLLIERNTPNQNAAGFAGDDNHNAMLCNRGKKSIALDLRQSEAIEIALRLVERADALIEGFRPGVMERLGLGPEVCSGRNPRLVYGRMTGWGQTGPLAQAAGHDPNYIALSGALWYGGDGTKPPTAPLTLVGDIGGGSMVLLFGLLSAIIHAQKTGEGQVVDCAITDGSAYISTLLWMMHNTGQIDEKPGSGWADFGAPWHGTYVCSDRQYITLCAIEPKFYGELISLLGLSDDPLFQSQWDKACWKAGRARLQEIIKERPREEWCRRLEGTDACFAPVLNFAEAPRHPHNMARGTFQKIGGVMQPAPAPKFSVSQPAIGPCPKSGEHAEYILEELGLNDSEIDQLRDKGVI